MLQKQFIFSWHVFLIFYILWKSIGKYRNFEIIGLLYVIYYLWYNNMKLEDQTQFLLSANLALILSSVMWLHLLYPGVVICKQLIVVDLFNFINYFT